MNLGFSLAMLSVLDSRTAVQRVDLNSDGRIDDIGLNGGALVVQLAGQTPQTAGDGYEAVALEATTPTQPAWIMARQAHRADFYTLRQGQLALVVSVTLAPPTFDDGWRTEATLTPQGPLTYVTHSELPGCNDAPLAVAPQVWQVRRGAFGPGRATPSTTAAITPYSPNAEAGYEFRPRFVFTPAEASPSVVTVPPLGNLTLRKLTTPAVLRVDRVWPDAAATKIRLRVRSQPPIAIETEHGLMALPAPTTTWQQVTLAKPATCIRVHLPAGAQLLGVQIESENEARGLGPVRWQQALLQHPQAAAALLALHPNGLRLLREGLRTAAPKLRAASLATLIRLAPPDLAQRLAEQLEHDPTAIDRGVVDALSAGHHATALVRLVQADQVTLAVRKAAVATLASWPPDVHLGLLQVNTPALRPSLRALMRRWPLAPLVAHALSLPAASATPETIEVWHLLATEAERIPTSQRATVGQRASRELAGAPWPLRRDLARVVASLEPASISVAWLQHAVTALPVDAAARLLTGVASAAPHVGDAAWQWLAIYPHPEVRAHAMRGLGAADQHAALWAGLDDPWPAVRLAALTALRCRSDKPELPSKLAQLLRGDRSVLVAALALEKLGTCAPAQALAELAWLWQAPRPPTLRRSSLALALQTRDGQALLARTFREWLHDLYDSTWAYTMMQDLVATLPAWPAPYAQQHADVVASLLDQEALRELVASTLQSLATAPAVCTPTVRARVRALRRHADSHIAQLATHACPPSSPQNPNVAPSAQVPALTSTSLAPSSSPPRRDT